MNSLKLRYQVGSDSILHLEVPVAVTNTALDVILSWQTVIETPEKIVAETDNLANSDSEDDLYDTPIEEIKASLRRSLEDVKEGRVRPISELWQRIDVE